MRCTFLQLRTSSARDNCITLAEPRPKYRARTARAGLLIVLAAKEARDRNRRTFGIVVIIVVA